MIEKVPLLRWITFGVFALLVLPALSDTRTRLDASRAEEWREHIIVKTPEDVANMILDGRNVVFVDVREPAEYDEFHLPDALPIPLREVDADPRTAAASLADADLVIPYCLKDFRGYEGARKLQAKGLRNVALMEGYGINAWKRAELPVAGALPGASDREALEALARALGKGGGDPAATGSTADLEAAGDPGSADSIGDTATDDTAAGDTAADDAAAGDTAAP